jgi:hypothetical protein
MGDMYASGESGLDVYVKLVRALETNKDAVCAVAVWETVCNPSRGKLGYVDFPAFSSAGSIELDIENRRKAWRLNSRKRDPMRDFGTGVWGAMAWRLGFWDYIKPEMHSVEDAVNAALDAGQHVELVHIGGVLINCNTPEDYYALIREYVNG